MKTSAPRLMHIVTVPVSLKTFFRGQAAHLRARGLETVSVASPGEELDAFGQRENVATRGVPMQRAVSPARDLVAIARLCVTLMRERPKIVHAHTPKAGMLGMIAAWLTRRPIRAYHCRGLPLETATGLRRRLLWLTEWTSCRLAHRVLCVSESLRGRLLQEGLCPASKAAVLASGSGNGVDSQQRFNPSADLKTKAAAIRKRLGIDPGDTVIGFVGRIVVDKGIVELAEAWATLREEFPRLRLMLVGTLADRDAAPESVIAALHGDPRVHLVAPTPEMPEYFTAMDIVALPTYREGLPNVLLEAAAMARPVVATRVTGCVDAVVDGRTGLLVPAADPRCLADSLRRYVADPDLRARHANAARRRVEQEFLPTVVWDALAKEYQRLARELGVALHLDERLAANASSTPVDAAA